MCHDSDLHHVEQRERVFLRPQWLVDVMKALVHHDLAGRIDGVTDEAEVKSLGKHFMLTGELDRRLLPWLMDLGRLRGANRKRARGVLGEALIPAGRAKPDEEARLRASLLELVQALDARLATPAQQWLCATEQPSAADFAVYGMLERLVGQEGDAFMGSATPWLYREAAAAKLEAWHARMVSGYPIRFRGKANACKAWSKL